MLIALSPDVGPISLPQGAPDTLFDHLGIGASWRPILPPQAGEAWPLPQVDAGEYGTYLYR